jgi:hypothetical protein
MADELDYRKMPSIDDNEFNIDIYKQLLYEYNNVIDSYNYMQKDIDYKSNVIRDMRDTISSLDTKIKESHRVILTITNEISSRFRNKEFKSVTWYNDILSKYRELGMDIVPIRTEDMYTAKVVISIDGIYRNSSHDMENIRQDIINNIKNNPNDFKVDINHIVIEDIYDVEELSESMEG